MAEIPLPVGVTSDGMLLAHNSAAIEQSRLYREAVPSTSVGVDANGTAIAETEATAADDDSFGTQKILKSEERVRVFALTAGSSLVYTDNALTRRGERADTFAVVDVAANWSPRIGQDLEASFGLRASMFRYHKTPDFDFQNLGFGAGLAWNPPSWRGTSLFARYDFTELFGGDGHQILMDHNLTLGVQKSVALGRSHGFTIGLAGVAGLSDPGAAQRSQIGAFLGYHLQLTRALGADFLYRPAVHFYTDSGRIDANQILSWNLRYRFTDWAELNASFGYGFNRSDSSVFDYNVLTTGVGLGVNVRF